MPRYDLYHHGAPRVLLPIRGLALCAIVKVSDDQIRAAGYDPEVFMRHELGHCNGWGSDHKGAR